jgi:hypothetical protein
MTQGSTPRWAIELTGHTFDIADWGDVLKQPFDPWGERNGETFVLRWSGFHDTDTAADVHEKAPAVVEQLNGAMWIERETRPLSIAGVIQYNTDGTRNTIMRAGTGHFEGRSRVTAHGIILRADGTIAPPPPPQPSEVQEWIRLSDTHEILADALVYFSRVEWFDIYKAIECLEAFVGGEGALRQLNWINATKFKQLKQTANSFRHRSGGIHKAPEQPVPLKEARQLLATLMRQAFKRVKR